jgi:Uma2 family endonuclease
MGLAEKYIPHYTYNDWIRWEGRWELIEGVPVAMSPMPLPEHQRVASELRTELTLALRKSGCKTCKAYDPLDYKIAEDVILVPDVLVVCGEINRSFLNFPPSLVIEILSRATEERDREVKYNYYEQDGVRFYLIVDTKKKTIEIFQLINGKYHLQPYRNNFTFTLNDDCAITPEFANIWDNL